MCTCLNDVAYRAEMYCTGGIVYAGYRIVMVSGHEYDDGLGNINVREGTMFEAMGCIP